MGKFNIKKINEKLSLQDREKQLRIKEAMASRPLLETIPTTPSKGTSITDGILLFGKHSGKNISDLLNSYDDSNYVTGYLAKSEDLPKRFKRQINEIIDNADPFGATVNVEDELGEPFNGIKKTKRGFKVREILENSDNDLPW